MPSLSSLMSSRKSTKLSSSSSKLSLLGVVLESQPMKYVAPSVGNITFIMHCPDHHHHYQLYCSFIIPVSPFVATGILNWHTLALMTSPCYAHLTNPQKGSSSKTLCRLSLSINNVPCILDLAPWRSWAFSQVLIVSILLESSMKVQ